MAYPDITLVTWDWGNYYVGNALLSTGQWELNVKTIENWLCYSTNSDRDMPMWTVNALCGFLGNVESESGFNPGIWQNLNYEVGPGLGLCQWTPYTNLTDYADSIHRDYWEMYTNLKRIGYEYQNGLQYYPTSEYNLSFLAYIMSDESPSYLAGAWLYNYERPSNPESELQARQTHANNWYTYLTGINTSPPSGARKKSSIIYWPKRKVIITRRNGKIHG